jgi:beta-hydroxylase
MALRFLAPQFVVLYCFAAAGLYVHYRGKVRHRFTRQLADHSTLTAPYNALMYLFSAVPNRPVLPVKDLPELARLRDNWETIRDEALSLFDEGHIRAAAKHNDWGFNSFFRSGWKRFYLKWYEDFLPSAKTMCPKTVELLDAMPTVHGALFAMLPPGGKLGAHRDPFAGSLRYHLGLVTPKSGEPCRIFVDGEPYTWRDGEDLLFDETYIHTAENLTNETRIILFCDVERPLKTRFMTNLNRWVIHHVVKATTTQNVDGEKVGAINKAFVFIYPITLVGKRMKAWNRKAYYALKYALGAALLAAILIPAFMP